MNGQGIRSLRSLLAALAVVVAGAILLAGNASSKQSVARAAATGGITFSHAVVVDEQRPGFEPDVKVAPDNTIFSSIPFGFSTTQSFVWDSLDGGNSYQFVPGTLPSPSTKPSTCIGGGDSDLYVDPGNALYFSDLQGLTNISDSVSTDGGATWSTTCTGAPYNSPDDRMWYAGTGSVSGGNLNLYQDFDQVDTSANGGNQLVEEVTHNGTSFQPVDNLSPTTTNCAGTAINCVTDNEGISGNQVVDPSTGIVYIAHTSTEGSSGTPGVRVSAGQINLAASPYPTGTWTDSPNLDGALCPDSTCADSSGNPEEIAGENFATIARDSAGYLYVTFTAGPLDHNSNDPNFGALTAPEQIYVVHSLAPAGSDPAVIKWSAPQRITGSGASAGTNTFPWIVAGSDGRAAVAYYHTNEISEQGTCASGSGTCSLYGAGSLSNAEWSVQMAQSLDAHSSSASYTTANVSEAYVKQGQICTNGLGCTTGGDRSLGDFLQIGIDNKGAALVSYVFDTSRDTSDGENAGPEVISRQTSGPSLLASAPSVSQGSGPGTPMGSVTDPTGDAYLSQDGTRTKAGDNLDLTGASLANGPGRTLIAKIDVKSLASLTPASGLGGPDASWILRWTDVVPGTTGNGHIYYAGMDNNQGGGGSGKPSFFAGDTGAIPPPGTSGEHTKYITYPQSTALSSSQASYDAKTGVITMHIPLSDVGNPANGIVLYSATAFSATSTTPQSQNTIFNLIDSTTPFELVIGAPGTVGKSPTGPPPFTSQNNGFGRCSQATGKLTQIGIARLRLGMKRSTARRLYPRWSTRGPKTMDFYCMKPTGASGGYPSNYLLRHFGPAIRRAMRGRIVLLLTVNRRYAFHGVRVGARFSKVARRLHAGRGFSAVTSVWYFPPNGASLGVIKVHKGIIVEIGLVNKKLVATRREKRRFVIAFWPFA